jgi:RES domain-containing protein
VKVRPNSHYTDFASKIRRSLKPRPWQGLTFRSVDLAYAAAGHVLSGEGNFLHGGRWNAPGSFPVIYSSTRPGTAVEEAFQLAANFELSKDDLRPRITCGIEYDLSSVIDLTASGVPRWIKLSKWLNDDFRETNDNGAETLCQALGRAARNAGIVGMFCPSVYIPGGINLVVFRDRLRKGDKMRLLGKEAMAKYLA